MFREKPVIAALTIGLTLLVACTTTTTLTSTWKAPDTQAINLSGKRIAAVFITADDSLRRTGENALVADFSARGAHGFGTFQLLPGDQHIDADTAQSRLQAAGADAVVMMRVVGKEQRIIYTPGYVVTPPYRGFRPYWGFGWRTVYQPGSLRTETDVSIETLVYSLPADQNSQLLWASSSRTTTANPANLTALVREVADATAREMANAGFLAR
jgi:hypothetical protein